MGIAVLWLALSMGCMSAYEKSVGGDTERVFSRIYLTEMNTAWQNVLKALRKNALDVSNRETGFVQTKWIDNTAEKNFIDSFGGAQAYLKAQYRFRVSVSEGFYNGRQSVKVAVQKEQMIQQDVLEGWKPVVTDTLEENTLLYRIGRLIYIHMKLAKMEEETTKKALQEQPAMDF